MQERMKGKKIVYVVDDDLDVREGLKSLFQSMRPEERGLWLDRRSS